MSILKRIGKTLVFYALVFIILSVIEKLFLKEEYWLYNAAIFTISWLAGMSVPKIFGKHLSTAE